MPLQSQDGYEVDLEGAYNFASPARFSHADNDLAWTRLKYKFRGYGVCCERCGLHTNTHRAGSDS